MYTNTTTSYQSSPSFGTRLGALNALATIIVLTSKCKKAKKRNLITLGEYEMIKDNLKVFRSQSEKLINDKRSLLYKEIDFVEQEIFGDKALKRSSIMDCFKSLETYSNRL
jgi:hypothetical protein